MSNQSRILDELRKEAEELTRMHRDLTSRANTKTIVTTTTTEDRVGRTTLPHSGSTVLNTSYSASPGSITYVHPPASLPPYADSGGDLTPSSLPMGTWWKGVRMDKPLETPPPVAPPVPTTVTVLPPSRERVITTTTDYVSPPITTFSANPTPLYVSGNDNVISSLKAERKELIDWGESLYKQCQNHLKTCKELERDVAALDADKRALESKCRHLEDLLRQKDPGLASTYPDEEVHNLRRQLEVYAREIDKLRAEKDAALEAVDLAEQRTHATTVERDRQMLLAQRGRRSYDELQSRQEQAQKLLHEATEMKSSYASEIRDKNNEKEVADARVKLAQEENADLRRQLDGAHHSLRNLKKLQGKAQDEFAQQTREYQSFVEAVQERQKPMFDAVNKAERDVDDLAAVARGHTQKLMQSNDDLSQKADRLEKLRRDQTQELRTEIDVMRDRAVVMEEAVSSMRKRPRAIVPQRGKTYRHLDQIMKGGNLTKACFAKKGHPRVNRFVHITPDVLRWGPDTKHQKRTTREIPLSDIIRVEYGNLAHVRLWDPDDTKEPPWRCFSFYTAKRSLDFVAHNDWDCEAWVMGMSTIVSAWSPAVVKSKGEYIIKRFLLKLDNYCKKRGISRSQAIKEAIRRSEAFLKT